MTPLSVVCFKWGSKYTAEHVNTLRRMIDRWYGDVRFICVTNEPAGLHEFVEVMPDRADFADIPSPHGNGAPSCFRRLRLFAPDAAETFGERIVSIDLDTVITGDMRPLWDRPEDFVGWSDPLYGPRQLCGSMFMLKAGALPHVWEWFDPKWSPVRAQAAGFRGSDQAWLSYCLTADAATWTRDDGVLSYRIDCKGGLPKDARVCFFHGNRKPWDCAEPWIKQGYQ